MSLLPCWRETTWGPLQFSLGSYPMVFSSQGQDSAYFLAAFLHGWEHSTPSCQSTVLWTQQKPLLDGEGFKKLSGAERVDPATGYSLQLAWL